MFQSVLIAILLTLGVCHSSHGYLDPNALEAQRQRLRPVIINRAKESRELAERFAPLVYFHPDEKYFPCSVEWFLKNAQLVKAIEPEKEYGIGPVKPIVTSAKVRELVKKGKVTEQDLFTWKKPKKEQADGQEVILDLKGDRKVYEGMPLNPDQTSPAPVYCKIIYQGPDNVALQYWFCYAYNGPFAPLSIGGRGPLGIHEGDWESIIVFIQKDTPQKIDNPWSVASVYLSRHGRDRGEHLKRSEWGALKFFDKTHPIIYSAKFGHGSYPNPKGLLPTSDGDLVAKGKASWPTWKNVEFINEKTPWIQFRGRWGLRGMGPNGPIEKPIWKSFPTDDQGNLISEKTHELVEIEAGRFLKEVTGIRFDSKKPVLFNLDISTHHFEHCWSLYRKKNEKWELASNVDFDVREKKFFGDKSWYHIKAGSGCVDPGTNALKGFYIRMLPSSSLTAGDLSADYKLVIHAKEPWPKIDVKAPLRHLGF